MNEKRKICIVINSRANYGRIKPTLKEIEKHPDLDLSIIMGASSLLYRFGNVADVVQADGFAADSYVYSIVEGENPTTMAKSTGLGIIELSTQLENLKPDIVLTIADRFETMATAIAASYMNIFLAHTQGGEVTGSIDETVRHAITKLSHLHFPATEKSAERLVKMGEEPDRIVMSGCPAMDTLVDLDLTLKDDFFEKYGGVGSGIDVKKPYLVVLQHPVTTEFGEGLSQIQETIQAVEKIGMQTVWLWPNVDAGSDDISKGLRQHRESYGEKSKIHFYRNFPVEDYARLIKNCACQIGNSSSAIREGSFLGVPGVNIGTRQNNREQGENIINTEYDAQQIEAAIRSQIEHGPYEPSKIFGDGYASKIIAETLASVDLNIHKTLTY